MIGMPGNKSEGAPRLKTFEELVELIVRDALTPRACLELYKSREDAREQAIREIAVSLEAEFLSYNPALYNSCVERMIADGTFEDPALHVVRYIINRAVEQAALKSAPRTVKAVVDSLIKRLSHRMKERIKDLHEEDILEHAEPLKELIVREYLDGNDELLADCGQTCPCGQDLDPAEVVLHHLFVRVNREPETDSSSVNIEGLEIIWR